MLVKNWSLLSVVGALALVLSAANTVSASIIITETKSDLTSESALQGVIPTLTNDLANSGQSTFLSITSSVPGGYGSNTTGLVDGTLFGGSGYSDTVPGYVVGNENSSLPQTATITIAFDTSVNTLGYDITKITTSSAYQYKATNQHYTVEVLKGGVWQGISGLGNVDSDGTVVWGRQMAIYDADSGVATGAAMVSGISAIRFNLTGPFDGSDIYREIDVVGTATAAVPEPGTLALLAGGLMGLIAYAWRKRK
jgi:hypothetical protein